MKKIVSILCGIILATTALWAEQINVTLSAPNNTSNSLITQTMGTLGGEKTLSEAWKGGEDGNSQQALMLNKKVGIGTNEASITFASPNYTIIHKYSFNVWYDWVSKAAMGREYNTDYKPEYKVNNDSYVTPGTTNNTNSVSKVNYSSQELKFTTNRKGLSVDLWIIKFDAEYRVFSNNWTFGITVPEVIAPIQELTTQLERITDSQLQSGTPVKRSTELQFTVQDPIGTTADAMKNYFEPILVSSSGESWSLGANWRVETRSAQDAVYYVYIPITYTATTGAPGNHAATIQLKPKHNVNYESKDYSVGRTRSVTIAVNQRAPYAIDWKPDGWINNGTITIFKGDSYERDDYLKNTDGLELGIPASSNPGVLSVDPTTGEITATEVGSTVLTYTQSGNDDYEEKTLTLNVNVIKRTPVFTLNSESTYTKNGNTYHVFYPNKSYPNFVTTTNGDLVNYPVTITPEGDMTNIISFNGVSAKVESALKDGIKITIFQQSGDLWMEKSQVFYISIRNNPMHVGTLCERTLQELFNDNYGYNEAKFEDESIVLGSNSKNTNGGYIIFRFEGTPDKLECSYQTTKNQDNSATWSLTQSIDGISFYPLGVGNTFDDEARYVKVAISGSYKDWTQTTYGVMGKITDICITERVGVEILPAEIELVKIGNEVKSAVFSAEVSNLTKVVLTINSSEFGLARTESDETQTSITLDYMDGLGIDQFATIPLVVKYTEDVDDSAIGKTCIITAKDTAENQLAVANVKVTGIILVDGVPQTILQANATNTGIYTGTETQSNTYPYCHSGRTEVNLSATFDPTGKALFDRLYIFGPTTTTDDSEVISLCTYYNQLQTPPNAITPCYIYTKSASGNGYEWTSTIANMNANSGTKPLPNITDAAGKKLYFTGFCPYASSGSGNQLGVVYIEGGAGEQVDVYMQNLFLHARYHTADGSAKFATNDTTVINLQLGTSYVEASGSAFVFASTTDAVAAPFSPNIHLLDSNKLDGGMGQVRASILTFHARAGLYFAPIHLYVNGASRATNLTIDDKWPTGGLGQTIRTNGVLNLCPKDVARPCIELGNANSTVNFDGGRIHLKNNLPVAVGEYTCTFAIASRAYTKTVDLSGTTVSATLCGMGEDQPEGKVNFNDGSIYCQPMTDAEINAYSSYYHNKMSIKCPVNTQINGGTFYCDVWACYGSDNKGGSPSNKFGDQLVKETLLISNTPAAPYYLATIDFDDFARTKVCNDNTHDAYGKTMKQYYDDLKTTYGSSSLKANGNQVVVMVPYQFTNKSAVQEVNNHPWAVAFPSLYASAGSYDGVEFGGPTTVLSTKDDRTRFLLYAEADETAFSALSDGYTAPNIPTSPIKDAKIEIGDYRNDVENDADYQIDEAQYMIKPILNADRWILFSPPFDVTNVYVLEACKELDLENMAKAGNREQAYKQQARATLDLFYYLGYYTVFNQGAEQFWSTYNYWRDNTKNPEARGAVPLKHFTGNNADANYYIQRSTGVWDWDGTKFTTDWKYLPENIEQVNHGGTLYNVVMKQGEVYSIKFPYMYDGYLEANQTNWDYWTGKYLILEGLGKQTIKGKDHHSKLQSAMTASQGSAEVRVNSTLAAMEVGDANAFYLQYNKLDGKNIYSSRFIKSIEDQEIYPTEGFVLANNPAAFVPGKKAAIDMMSGVVTYEDDTEDSENGEAKTPTISGGHSLLVYTVETGLGLFPFAPQQVYIYNAAGQLVTSLYLSEETYVALPAGIYLVRGENEQVKAMVK